MSATTASKRDAAAGAAAGGVRAFVAAMFSVESGL
jgi:hypothetical protein